MKLLILDIRKFFKTSNVKYVKIGNTYAKRTAMKFTPLALPNEVVIGWIAWVPAMVWLFVACKMQLTGKSYALPFPAEMWIIYLRALRTLIINTIFIQTGITVLYIRCKNDQVTEIERLLLFRHDLSLFSENAIILHFHDLVLCTSHYHSTLCNLG